MKPKTIIINYQGDLGDAFGKVLKQIRTEKGLTQTDLFYKTGIDKGVISKLENGDIKEPRLSVFVWLCKALDIDPDEMIRLVLQEHQAQEAQTQSVAQ